MAEERQVQKRPDQVKSGSVVKERTTQKIIENLRRNPSFLFFFSIVLLVLGGGTGALLVNLTSGAVSPIAIGVLALLGLIIVASLVVIRMDRKPLAFTGSAHPLNDDFRPILHAIQENLQGAIERVHPVFHDWMKKDCQSFQSLTDAWADGQLRTTATAYKQLLVDAYENAKETAFATSTPDYMPVWKGVLGAAILKAHKAAPNAKVVRVFLFDSQATVPADALDEMKKQHQDGVEVLVFGAQESINGWDLFQGGVNRNFVFIDDGAIIGSTEPAAGNDFSGTWHFKEPNHQARYSRLVKDLRRESALFVEFMEKHHPGWNKGNQQPSAAAPAVPLLGMEKQTES